MAASESFRKEVAEKIDRVVHSSDPNATVSFRSTLSAEERKYIHDLADELGLKHESKGPKDARKLVVSKEPPRKGKGKGKGKREAAKGPRQAGKAQGDVEEAAAPNRKLYVGNIASEEMTDAKLRELFKTFGEILSVELVTTASRAFGFVEFAALADAESALEKMNGQSGLLVKFARGDTKPAVAPAAPLTPATSEEVEEEEEQQQQQQQEEESESDDDASPDASRTAPAHDGPDPGAIHAAVTREYANPVESLQDLVQKATRATSTSDMIRYSVDDADKGTFVATVELLVFGFRASHAGEPSENKREAKKSAARAALRDPAVHRSLPPLPAKIKEPSAVKKASVSDSEEEAVSADKVGDGAALVVSAKKQRQLEKAELRAKKLAARRAAKEAELRDKEAALAAQAAQGSDSDEATEADFSSEEESSAEDEEEDGESSEEDGEELVTTAEDAAMAENFAAAVKAALRARQTRRRPGKHAGRPEIKSEATESKKKVLDKPKKEELKMVGDSVRETRMQANFGQTKFIKP